MIVVSNTSPITNLAIVDQLDLLQPLYGTVIIPQAVRHEIDLARTGRPDLSGIDEFDWIEIRRVTNRAMVASLQLELDAGEAEAIALAIEMQADLLLLDERKGRAVAARLGLRFIGLLGVLMEAKHRGLVPTIRPVVDDLVGKAGFWISRELYHHVLQAAGE